MIHVSNKLRDNLKDGKLLPPPDLTQGPGLGHWNAHLVYLGGKKCLFFMHEKTAYAIMIPGVKKQDLEDITGLFVPELLKWLKQDGIFNLEISNKILAEYETLTLAKTNNNKKVLGLMNDRWKWVQHWYDAGRISYSDWSFLQQVNQYLIWQGKNITRPVVLMQELVGQW